MPIVSLSITGQPVFLKRLHRRLPANIKMGLRHAAIHLEGVVKKDFLSGQYLNVGASSKGHIGGTLRQSITHSDVMREGGGFFVKVGSAVKYARIHELGGVTGKNYAVTLRARHYFRDALRRERKKLLRIIRNRMMKLN